MHPHWTGRGSTRLAMERAKYPGLEKMTPYEFALKAKAVGEMRVRIMKRIQLDKEEMEIAAKRKAANAQREHKRKCLTQREKKRKEKELAKNPQMPPIIQVTFQGETTNNTKQPTTGTHILNPSRSLINTTNAVANLLSIQGQGHTQVRTAIPNTNTNPSRNIINATTESENISIITNPTEEINMPALNNCIPSTRATDVSHENVPTNTDTIKFTTTKDDILQNSNRQRLSSKQLISIAAEKEEKSRKRDIAYMEAFEMYLEHSNRPKSKRKTNGNDNGDADGDPLSSRQVASLVGMKYGVTLASNTIARKVSQFKKDGTPMLMKRPGASGHFSDESYNALKGAFSSGLYLKRIGKSAKEIKKGHNEWRACLGTLLGNGAKKSAGKNLYERLQRDISPMLNADKNSSNETNFVAQLLIDDGTSTATGSTNANANNPKHSSGRRGARNKTKLPVTSQNFQIYVETVINADDLVQLERINRECVDFLVKDGWKTAHVLRTNAPKVTEPNLEASLIPLFSQGREILL